MLFADSEAEIAEIRNSLDQAAAVARGAELLDGQIDQPGLAGWHQPAFIR